MDLKIKDVADLLNVSESTIQQWISEEMIPFYRINQHYYFSRSEIENWVMLHKLDNTEGISPFTRRKEMESMAFPMPRSSTLGSKQFSLFRAIHKGDVLHHLKGNTKEEIIRMTMRTMAKEILNVDAEVMIDLLLDRENLMPTALNNGIAVPHTRDTLLNAHHDVVIVVFLDIPLEYGALDGEAVNTLFFLFACEDKRHLHLLAKIAHLSSQNHVRDFFKTKPSKDKLLSFIKDWESQIPKASPSR